MFIATVFRFRYGVVDCCGLRLIVLVFAFYWCGLNVIMVCYLVARVCVVFVWLVGCGFFLDFEGGLLGIAVVLFGGICRLLAWIGWWLLF